MMDRSQPSNHPTFMAQREEIKDMKSGRRLDLRHGSLIQRLFPNINDPWIDQSHYPTCCREWLQFSQVESGFAMQIQ